MILILSFLKSLIPPVMKESDMNLSGETPTGIINRVELVYLGEDQLLAEVEEGRTLYAQPFWRFSGYLQRELLLRHHRPGSAG